MLDICAADVSKVFQGKTSRLGRALTEKGMAGFLLVCNECPGPECLIRFVMVFFLCGTEHKGLCH